MIVPAVLPLKACRVCANCDVVHIYLSLEMLPRPLRYRVITLRFNTDTLYSSSID